MKNYLPEEYFDTTNQLFRKMRTTCLILVVFATSLFATDVNSQIAKVNIAIKDAYLIQVIKAIESQTDYLFVYDKNEIDLTRKVDLVAENKSVAEILTYVFSNTNVVFAMEGTNIMLMQKSDSQQQQKSVSGKVTDPTGALLPGVSVVVKGTIIGVITDTNGNYTLSNVPANATLQFSFVGMKSQEIAIGGKTIINVTLIEETVGIDEVVVTALGIERSAKSITYSSQKITGDEQNRVPQTNLMNSLTGKVAGMTINPSAGGLGGSVKVLLRGNKSAQGSNQPLYVVDGIPLPNFARESGSDPNSGGNTNNTQDNGDGISNLNPNDIESISILKGASSAALYGSQAANGVILITTKKGKAGGVSKVDFTSSCTVDQVAYTPKLQNSYGETSPGSPESWGAPISNAKDNIADFFQKGSTFVNSVNFSSGTEKIQTYVSYANTSAKGIVEGNKLSRHNILIHESMRFFNDKLKLDADVNFISQTLNNSPVYGNQSVLYPLYLFPRGKDFAPYKKDYQIFDPVRNLYTQNWPFIGLNYNQNPYWIINKNLYTNKRDRSIFNIGAKYDIASWLNIQLRGNMDKTNELNTRKFYAGSAPGDVGPNGAYYIFNITRTQYYGDALLNITHSFGELQLKGVLGASVTDSRASGQNSGSNDLAFANIFTVQNMRMSLNSGHGSESEDHEQLQAVFGNINLSYKDWFYVDVTGRNDWSSNLSYTPNVSYFYPSVGMGVLLHQLASLPKAINFAKLRASYAIVGNTVPLYVTNPMNYYSFDGSVSFNNTAPFSDLEPEKTRSLELGTEMRFLQNQFSVDFSYYKTNTINQFFSIVVPPGTGYSRRFINGGDIQNSGVELMAGYTTLPNKTIGWSSSINFSANKNVVKKLATSVDQFVLSNDINNYSSILKVGGSYGDIYAPVLNRDSVSGKVIINSEGSPSIRSGAPSFVGNANPKFKLGWNNDFSYKNFKLSFLVDGSFGGKVMSLTQEVLDGFGVSKASGDARNNGGVAVDGISEVDGAPVTLVDAHKWYSIVGGIAHATGEYMYDATNIRIREVSLGYSLPARILQNGPVKNIRISLIGRNLVYLYKKAPFDPDITFSTGNGITNVEGFTLPATRSIGLNLNVSF